MVWTFAICYSFILCQCMNLLVLQIIRCIYPYSLFVFTYVICLCTKSYQLWIFHLSDLLIQYFPDPEWIFLKMTSWVRGQQRQSSSKVVSFQLSFDLIQILRIDAERTWTWGHNFSNLFLQQLRYIWICSIKYSSVEQLEPSKQIPDHAAILKTDANWGTLQIAILLESLCLLKKHAPNMAYLYEDCFLQDCF
jgi:hypothetical protein